MRRQVWTAIVSVLLTATVAAVIATVAFKAHVANEANERQKTREELKADIAKLDADIAKWERGRVEGPFLEPMKEIEESDVYWYAMVDVLMRNVEQQHRPDFVKERRPPSTEERAALTQLFKEKKGMGDWEVRLKYVPGVVVTLKAKRAEAVRKLDGR